MRLAIPKSQRESFKQFISLPDEKWGALLQALEAAEPAISAHALAKQISPNVDLSIDQLRQVIVMAGSLYMTRDQRGTNVEEFAEAVVEEAVHEDLEGLADPAAAAKLKERILRLLSLDSSLGVSAKATQLLFSHKNPLLTARIFTDIRPVFTGDEKLVPRAAVVSHTLELVTSTDGRRLSHYIALDSSDLETLKRVVDRAIHKEASLKTIMSSLPLVEIKEDAEE
jgi:hypothetical protein